MKMQSLIVIALSTAAAFAAAEPCNLKALDKCTAELIPFATTTRVGETPDAIDQDCVKATKSVECFHDMVLTNCATSGVAKGVFKLVHEGALSLNSQRCDPSHPRKKDYDQYIPCLNTVGAKLRDCMRKGTAEFEAITRLPLTVRVHNACCAFKRTDSCLREVAEKGCSKAHADYVTNSVKTLSQDVTDTVCARFKADSCNELAPLRTRKRSYQSAIAPIVQILNI